MYLGSYKSKPSSNFNLKRASSSDVNGATVGSEMSFGEVDGIAVAKSVELAIGG